MCSLLQYIVFFPHLLESNIMPSTQEEVLCSSHNGTVFNFGYLSQSCTCQDNHGKLSTKLIIFLQHNDGSSSSNRAEIPIVKKQDKILYLETLKELPFFNVVCVWCRSVEAGLFYFVCNNNPMFINTILFYSMLLVLTS